MKQSLCAQTRCPKLWREPGLKDSGSAELCTDASSVLWSAQGCSFVTHFIPALIICAEGGVWPHGSLGGYLFTGLYFLVPYFVFPLLLCHCYGMLPLYFREAQRLSLHNAQGSAMSNPVALYSARQIGFPLRHPGTSYLQEY